MAEYILSTAGEAQNLLNGIILASLFSIDENTPSDAETDYKPLYFGLFNGITSIIKNTTTFDQTIAALKYLQCAAEDAYINQDECP